MAWIDEGIDQENSLRLWRDSETGQYQYGAYGSNEPPAPLTPLPTGFSYIPATETTEAYYRGGTQSNPVVMSSNPNAGFDNQLAALNSLYTSYIGGDPNQLAQVINQFKDQYAAHGINAGNAAQLLEQNFYDRIHNIDKNDFIDVIGQGALAGLYGAAFGDFTGLLNVDNIMGNLFGSPSGYTSAGADGVVGDGWGTDAVSNGVKMDDYYSMLDDIQASTNGVTAPSHTLSIPGYGDVYGSTSTILKSLVGSGLSPTNALSMLQKALGGDTSALSALGGALSGSGSSSIWDMFGKLLPAGLGMYASNQQANKLSELAQKYQDFGAPYRQQLADISANPDNFYNSLGAQKATDAVLNKLSIGGNPAGSANKQALTISSLYDQYGKERDRLAGFGGLTNYNQAAPQLETQAINSNANMWNAAGAGLNDIFNPKTSLADLLKQGKIV